MKKKGKQVQQDEGGSTDHDRPERKVNRLARCEEER